MSTIDVGTICIKTKGRKKGKKCVLIDVIDKNFVLITGPKSISGIKRQRANIVHLSSTFERIKLKRGASDKEVLATLKKNSKEDFMKQ